MVSDAEYRAVEAFLYKEARFADEARLCGLGSLVDGRGRVLGTGDHRPGG